MRINDLAKGGRLEGRFVYNLETGRQAVLGKWTGNFYEVEDKEITKLDVLIDAELNGYHTLYVNDLMVESGRYEDLLDDFPTLESLKSYYREINCYGDRLTPSDLRKWEF